MADMSHGIVKCKYCDKVIRQCRCTGPHETTYEFCSPECKRREKVNEHQVAQFPHDHLPEGLKDAQFYRPKHNPFLKS